MVEVGRHLWRLSDALCSVKATWSWLLRTMFRWFFNISKDKGCITSVGSLCQCSVTSTEQKWFLTIRRNFLPFSLCPFLPVLLLGTTEKSQAPAVFASSLQVFIQMRFALSPLFCSLNNAQTYKYLRGRPVQQCQKISRNHVSKIS